MINPLGMLGEHAGKLIEKVFYCLNKTHMPSHFVRLLIVITVKTVNIFTAFYFPNAKGANEDQYLV